MAFSTEWNTAVPADSDPIGQGANEIRKTKAALEERLSVEHVFGESDDDGLHKQVTMKGKASAPSIEDGEVKVFAKTDGDEAKFGVIDKDGEHYPTGPGDLMAKGFNGIGGAPVPGNPDTLPADVGVSFTRVSGTGSENPFPGYGSIIMDLPFTDSGDIRAQMAIQCISASSMVAVRSVGGSGIQPDTPWLFVGNTTPTYYCTSQTITLKPGTYEIELAGGGATNTTAGGDSSAISGGSVPVLSIEARGGTIGSNGVAYATGSALVTANVPDNFNARNGGGGGAGEPGQGSGGLAKTVYTFTDKQTITLVIGAAGGAYAGDGWCRVQRIK